MIAVFVGGAAQARDQVVGEHRAGDRARLLRQLVGARRAQHHQPRELRCEDVDLELVDRRAAFARDRAGLARVDHRELDRRRQRAQRVLQLAMREWLAAQVEVRIVGVARVVDEHQRVFAARIARDLAEPAQRRADLGGRRVAQQLDAVGREPTERDQHVAHALRVVLGVAQRAILRPTRVRSDEQRVPLIGKCRASRVRSRTRWQDRVESRGHPNAPTDGKFHLIRTLPLTSGCKIGHRARLRSLSRDVRERTTRLAGRVARSAPARPDPWSCSRGRARCECGTASDRARARPRPT